MSPVTNVPSDRNGSRPPPREPVGKAPLLFRLSQEACNRLDESRPEEVNQDDLMR